MIKAKFTENMIQLLAKLKGTEFFEYITDDLSEGKISYCKIGIECEDIILDIYNEVEGIEWFVVDGEKTKEDLSVFSCTSRERNEMFIPYLKNTGIIRKKINEKITGVSIISDVINVNNGEYCIDYDMAVVIETMENKYVFSRGWYFGEDIYININSNFDEIYPIDKVIDSWKEDGNEMVKVTRNIRTL